MKTAPLKEEIKKIDAGHDTIIAKFQELAGMAKARIREFEVREQMEILGEREVPAQSGVPEDQRHSVRPGVKRRASR